MAKDEKKTISDPALQFEQALNMVLEDKPESVELRGKKVMVGDIKKGTIRKITDIQLSDASSEEGGVSDTRDCKIAAAVIINNWWGLCFLGGLIWALRWRWYYYIKQYTSKELLSLTNMCKKKVELEMAASTMNTILQTAMRDTKMAKTREEVKRIQAESILAAHGQQPKNSETSQPADTSSSGSSK